MNLSISKYSKKVNECPLCGNKSFVNYSKHYHNRYSDEFSKILNTSESFLLKYFRQIKCKKCKLIYKRNWFKDSFLKHVYEKVVPVHPTGWDTNSKKFSKLFLRKQLIKYLEIINKKQTNILEDKNKYKRIILSIIHSIKINNKIEKKEIKNFEIFIDAENQKQIIKKQKAIVNLVSVPKSFSRFSGVGNEKLFNTIIKKIGNIKSYSEIGCPLWGMINISKKKGLKNYFIKPDEKYFWGKGCSKNNLKCIQKLDKQTKIINLTTFKKKIDYVGIYNYIDHVDNLSGFLKNIFKITNSIGIIVENSNRGYPIQHKFGLTEENFNFISKTFNKKLLKFGKNLVGSKSVFYLLY
jgi:hypothetical protein